MSETTREEWDLEAVYDEEIAPLMTKIIDICKAHRMPMVASFAYASDADETRCCTTSLPFLDGRSVETFNKAARLIRHGEPGRIVAMTITTEPTR